MATVKVGFLAKLQTTRGADIEERRFSVGDEVSIIATWQDRFLIKDHEGHFYNVLKEYIEP